MLNFSAGESVISRSLKFFSHVTVRIESAPNTTNETLQRRCLMHFALIFRCSAGFEYDSLFVSEAKISKPAMTNETANISTITAISLFIRTSTACRTDFGGRIHLRTIIGERNAPIR